MFYNRREAKRDVVIVLNSNFTEGVEYYVYPYRLWKRGSNENTNKIIRRFIPKGSNINEHSYKEVSQVEQWINKYPRKILEYKTANEIFETS